MTRMRTAFLLPMVIVWSVAQAQLSCSFLITPENCTEANGSITALVGGGTAPYSYVWSPAPPNGQGTASISGLSAGGYDVTVTDDLGLQQTFSANVPNDPTIGPAGPGTLAGAEPYVGFGVPCTGQCNGAMAFPATMFSGTPPYSFDWGPPQAYTTQGDPIFVGLCAGQNYPYTVSDAFGCSSFGYAGPLPELDTAWYWSVDQITPASCGNADGILHLTQTGAWPAEVVVSQGGQVVLSTTTNGSIASAIGGLAAGAYEVLFDYNASGCTSSLTFTMPEVGPGCGSVTGVLFADADTDCVQDGGEPGIPYRTLQVDPGAQLAITGTDGRFAADLIDGAYTLTVLDPAVEPTCPQAEPIPFTVSGGSTTLDIGASAGAPMDLAVSAVNNAARPGFGHTAWARVTELGGSGSGTITVTAQLLYPLTFVSATPAPTSVLPNQVSWVLPALTPFATLQVQVTATVDVQAPLGASADIVFTAVNDGPETNLANNSWTTARTITGAFDPNDKTAFTSTGQSASEYILSQDEWIDYVIRFQNTGTDTAFTVVITDTLASSLDMATFEQGAASHPFTVSFKPDRVVEWRFANILLPDSNVNEPGSHGAVGFRIRPHQPVVAGTVLANAADIYFDFNAPVRTNTSTLVATVGTGVPVEEEASLLLFPNPARDRITIRSFAPLEHLQVMALDGRVVLQRRLAGDRAEVDLRGLAPGAYRMMVTGSDGRRRSRPIIVER